MYTARSIKLTIILKFAWKAIVFFFFYSAIITSLYVVVGLHFIAMPFLPISLIGTAVAFYVGFKNNSSYARLWEARKIWGALINLSRTFGTYVMSFPTGADPTDLKIIKTLQKKLMYRQLAFVNALRIRLRSRSTWENNDPTAQNIVKRNTLFTNGSLAESLNEFLSEEEADLLTSKTNQCTQLMHLQSITLREMEAAGYLNTLQRVSLAQLMGDIINQQGACERIKSFPFPRQYAFFSKVFVWLFILILPFGLVGEFAKLGQNFVWLTIPFHMLVAWVFNTMEIVGDTSENPFENGINDIPMTAICRTIEIDLREMLQETNIPKPITPIENILM